MKNILVIFMIVCLAGAVVLLTLSVTRDSRAALDAVTQGTNTEQISQIDFLPNMKKHDVVSIQSLAATEHEMTFYQDLDVTEEELLQSVWCSDDGAIVGSLEQQLAVEEYQTVAFNQTMYLDIGVGDKINLELPDGQQLLVEVTSQKLNLNGDFTWQGEINQDGQNYPVVMTQDQFGTYGSIATNGATYTVTTTAQGIGVVYKNQPLIETNEDDFLEVPVHS